MRKLTQHFIETALRADKTCDDKCIVAAISAAKGNVSRQYYLGDMDWVMSRKEVSARLNLSVRTVSKLANKGQLKRVRTSKRGGRVLGYSAKSVSEYMTSRMV